MVHGVRVQRLLMGVHVPIEHLCQVKSPTNPRKFSFDETLFALSHDNRGYEFHSEYRRPMTSKAVHVFAVLSHCRTFTVLPRGKTEPCMAQVIFTVD